MVVGFNHNFRYKGEIYHIQTEDGGLKSPNIVTLLYKAGTILASKKTSYADITKIDRLEQVVEELMKEQHKEMLHRLKQGDFDAIIEGRRPGGNTPGTQAASSPPAGIPQDTPGAGRHPEPGPAVAAPAAGSKPSTETSPVPESSPPAAPGLDDIILAYLMGDDQK